MPFDKFSKELGDLVKERFGSPTPIQSKAMPHISEGKDVLILASTGSGKTETALLPIFDKLVKEQHQPISALYITPLRALNRNLHDRLLWWASKLNLDISTRHGDTSQYERSKQAENPPDILISTPETLQSILVGKVMREHLRNIKYVIVDEIHELVGSKRGVQLSIGLERLRELAGNFQIVGLSATVGSKEEVSKFLSGGRQVEIVDVSGGKRIDITVESPVFQKGDKEIMETGRVSPQVASRLRKIWDISKDKDSVLIFTNTRESAEVLSSRLKLLDSNVQAHHSSLAKSVRIEAEQKFKDKEISHLVCTSSLELGIDIGSIDFILQFMSPRQVSKLLQRIGRSGHDLKRVSEGVIVTGETDDVFESTAIAKLGLERKIEKTPTYGKSLDVLGHQIVGLSLEGDIEFEKAFELIKRAFPFHNLTKDEFFEVCMFMDKLGYVFVGDKFTPGKVFIRRKKRGWEYYYRNLSTIPDVKNYQLFDIISNQPVGNLDAEFVALNGSPGTNIICKGQTWKILELRNDRLYVEAIGGLEAAIPAWEGELIPVPFEVAQTVAEIRRQVAEKALTKEKDKSILDFLKNKYPISTESAETILNLVKDQIKFGFVPDSKNILIETIEPEDTDDSNYRLIFHTCFGSLINDTIGRALTTLLINKIGSVGLQTDPYRIILTLQSFQWKEVIETFKNIQPNQLESLLELNLTNTEMFRWRFLHVAKRFGIISKDADYGKAYLKKIIEVYSKSPAYKEALNEIFEDKLDIENTKDILDLIKKGYFKMEIKKGPSPLGKLGLTKRYEIVPPEKPTQEIFEIFKHRLENTEIGLVCCQCGKWSAVYTVKLLPKAIICPVCGARLVGAVPAKYAEDARKLVKKNSENKKLTEQEKKWVNITMDSGSLVITYGLDAVKVMAGRGIGVATAKRVLSKFKRADTDKVGVQPTFGEDLFHVILDAERQYAKNRRFWKG
ncbi:MAG: DEAD/DEAH box helicase [Candidatus Aenigmarchaeota archaeon]|nr:DEAD/DEAH box helicase [Candidatus Aenigmarchaeota archaeon]